jgi:ubiquinone biosynthesis protein COQ9
MIIYNDKGLDQESCTPELIDTGKELMFNFEGYWEYYLSDLIKWLQKNPDKMYLDAGRGFYVKPEDVKEKLKELLGL